MPRTAARCREPLWLDRQLAGRLSAYLSCAVRAPDEVLPEHPEEASRSHLQSRLRVWQWRMLARTVLHAAGNSLFYRKTLGSEARELLEKSALGAGLPGAYFHDHSGTPSIGRHPQAWERAIALVLAGLPTTLPEDLAAAPEAFLAVGQSDVSGIISLPTSGTTGAAKRIFCSEEDLRETADFFRHGMRYLVLPGRGDHVALLMSGTRPGSVGDLLVRGLSCLGVPCSVPGFVPLDQEGEDALLESLVRLSPSCLVGVPGQVLLLSRHPKASLLAKSLRSVLLSGDSVSPRVREAIRRGFGCEVFAHYGLTESGLGGAVECREHAGCHMREADLIHEIVDAQGRPLPDGAWGEIAVTTLTRNAMPLLRYRTGDEGRLLPGFCRCGSVLGRLEVRGRIGERIPLPGKEALRSADFDQALCGFPFLRGYRLVLHGQGACLAVHVQLLPEAGKEALATAARALAGLPGLRLAGSAEDLQKGDNLPVIVLREESIPARETHTEILRRGQAKQRIVRTDAPAPCDAGLCACCFLEGRCPSGPSRKGMG